MSNSPKYRPGQIVTTTTRLPHTRAGEFLETQVVPAGSNVAVVEVSSDQWGLTYRYKIVTPAGYLWADESDLTPPFLGGDND